VFLSRAIEGIGLQMGSVVFVLGSYVIATWLNKRKQQNKRLQSLQNKVVSFERSTHTIKSKG
jgi:aminoglycoside N3'-acetyltransferase